MSSDRKVVLEMVLQAPCVDKCAQAQVAEDLMARCMVDVVL